MNKIYDGMCNTSVVGSPSLGEVLGSGVGLREGLRDGTDIIYPS